MRVYYLLPPGERIVHQLSNPLGKSSKVDVQGGDYYDARAKAIDHALHSDERHILVVCNTARILERERGGTMRPHPLDTNREHGLILYVRRLLERFAHVYVPPVEWGARLPLCGLRNHPTLPMVAAYRLSALAGLDWQGHLGRQLCAQGYDSFAVGDYVYERFGPVALDESGSATTWSKTYERAIADFL